MVGVITTLILALFVSVPTQTNGPLPQRPALVQPAPSPHDLTLYNEKGEQVAKCLIVEDGTRITGCHINSGFTLDDVMTAWANAFKQLEQEKQ